jgi:predicted transcriptional regulator
MEEKMKGMVAKGMKVSKIAKKMNVTPRTVSRYIKEWKKQAA